MNAKSTLFFSLCILFLSAVTAEGIDITATGTWNQSIGPANLISGPGSDLTRTYTSAANATLINISDTKHEKDWVVSVSRQDSRWDASLTLSVKRTSDGSRHQISGGTTYIPITASPTTFFIGKHDNTGIYCQYKLQGMSLDISPADYRTTVIYTVTERHHKKGEER